MKEITYRVILDLAKEGVQAVLAGFKAGDSSARKIQIHFMNQGEPYFISENLTALINAVLPGGGQFTDTCTVENGVVSYVPDDALLAADGEVTAEIEIGKAEGERFASPTILLLIAKNEVDFPVVVKTDQYKSLVQAIAAAREVVEREESATIKSAKVNEDYHLILEKANGDSLDAGYVRGEQGEKGEKGDKGERGEKGDKGDPGDVTNIPIASYTSAGIGRTTRNYGLYLSADGVYTLKQATEDSLLEEAGRGTDGYGAITTENAKSLPALFKKLGLWPEAGGAKEPKEIFHWTTRPFDPSAPDKEYAYDQFDALTLFFTLDESDVQRNYIEILFFTNGRSETADLGADSLNEVLFRIPFEYEKELQATVATVTQDGELLRRSFHIRSFVDEYESKANKLNFTFEDAYKGEKVDNYHLIPKWIRLID